MHNRDVDVALTYHEETKHSYDSVYRHHHFLDFDNQPRSFKLYTTLAPMPLPDALPASNMPALTALTHSGDVLNPGAAHLTLTDLAYVLFYAAGVTKRRIYPGHGEMLFRAAACTGALYHIELYLATTDLPGIASGLYHYSPIDQALRLLRRGDYRQVLVEASGHDVAVQDVPVMMIGSDTFWRNAWKYRARSYRHSFWDAGTILANLLAAATARGLPARIVMGFADALVNTLLDLDTRREVATFLVGLGRGASPAVSQPAVEPLNLEVAPLSREEMDYPAIRIMHEASALDSPEEAEIWRDLLPHDASPTATAYSDASFHAEPSRGVRVGTQARELNVVFPLCPELDHQGVNADLEGVIRRRGSTRQFSHRPLSLTQLSNVLVAATSGLPADFLAFAEAPLNDVYLIVNAVSELPMGAYVFRVAEQSLELLQAGDFRHQAGMLALGQDLAADASVNIYFLCELPWVLAQFGNRGYRVAQLEAGIRGGRIYLAAYAQGFGATGLTFFDDDVSEFFSPHATGKSVMFLTALGYAAKPRR